MRTSTRLGTVLKDKGCRVWSVSPECSVFLAIAAMAQYGVGSVLVMEGPRLLGIITERDYTRRVILQGRSSKLTAVGEIMSEVVTLSPSHTVADAMRVMTEMRVRHLAVTENDEVSGVLSIGDLVKWIISEQEEHIAQLELLIAGSYPG